MLYRVFPFHPDAAPAQEGGALFVLRWWQGSGRHDAVDLYGALYASRTPLGAVAERVKHLRGRTLADEDLLGLRGLRYAVAELDDSGLGRLVDLDDPVRLVERSLRPSSVATNARRLTQAVARRIYAERADGFEWWSTLEASWINVTLFAERAVPKLRLASDPSALSLNHPAVRDAARSLGVRLPA